MKKIFSTILIIVISCLVLSGCSFGSSPSNNNPSNNNPQNNGPSDNIDINNSGELTGEQVYDKAKKCVVEIQTFDKNGNQKGTGSGFYVSSYEICTNYHVIDGAYSLKIFNYNGTISSSVNIKGYDKDKDIASLKVNDNTNIEYLTTDETIHNVGETIYTLGSSKGLTGSFSDGVIASNDRIIEGISCYQITAPISPGNSGGPLLSKSCEVLGINSMTLVDGQNINFAIKIKEYINLNKNKNLTVQQFYDSTNDSHSNSGGNGGNGNSGGNGGTDKEDTEWISESEPNDNMYTADRIQVDKFYEGTIDQYDMDYYKIYVSSGTLMSVAVALVDEIDYKYVVVGLFDKNENAVAAGNKSKDIIELDFYATTSDYYYLIIFRKVECPYQELPSKYGFTVFMY